jgi:hypothetical protein
MEAAAKRAAEEADQATKRALADRDAAIAAIKAQAEKEMQALKNSFIPTDSTTKNKQHLKMM